jgi:hypothetical protein
VTLLTADKDLLGVNDIARHDPSAGSVQQSFNRVAPPPTNLVSVDKVSAASIPALDPAYVATLRGAFYELHAGTPTMANLNLEAIVRLLRKNSPHYINFEGVGGIPNDSADATAEKNRLLWDFIIAAIIASGRGGGIYFPTADWYFKRPAADAGSVVLPLYRYNIANDRTPANLVILGESVAARLLTSAGVPKTDDLLVAQGRGVTIAEITVDKVVADATNNGKAVRMSALLGNPVLYPTLLRATLKNGGNCLYIEGLATTNRNLLASGCIFDGSFSKQVEVRDMAGAIFTAPRCFGINANAGVLLHADRTAGVDESISDIFMSDAQLFNFGEVTLKLEPTAGAFDSAKHGRIKINQALCPAGFNVQDLDSVDLGTVTAAAIVYALTRAVPFSKFRARNSQVIGASGLNIVAGGGATLQDFEVDSGTYSNNTTPGVLISSAHAASSIRHGRIKGLTAKENVGPGVHLSVAAGSISGVLTAACNLYDLKGGAATQTYGWRESGACDYNLIDASVFEGNVTAPFLVVGANSIIGTNVYK